VFPKYAHLPWISMSLAQRVGMPQGTNWLANIYHGLPANQFNFTPEPAGNYVAFLGRIIEPKGAHLAIQAVREYNKTAAKPLTLKIAGKHYAGHKDAYWQEQILPHLGHGVEYVGFINTIAAKQDFLGNARALLVPSTFDEPFGMVLIEALACGTPVVGLRAGAIPEIIRPARTGALADKTNAVHGLSQGLREALTLNRRDCRDDFEARFTLDRMCREHLTAYQKLKN
jgi:glycosyltransferase involved in cell wall biosynthesis